MLRRPTTLLVRTVALAMPAAAPGLVILAGLVLAGILHPVPAVVLAAAVVVASTLAAARLALSIGALGDTVEELAAEASPQTIALGARRAVDEIRLAVQRRARSGRERAEAAEARLAAAEAVIAAVPDPLILLDERRRIVRANTAAAALVGGLSPPCDLLRCCATPRC